MIAKNDKRLFVSGVYFIIAAFGYTLYKILLPFYIRVFYAIDGYPIAWGDILFALISNVILILYCFKLHKTDAEKNIYLFGIGVFALVRIYFIFSANGRFDAYVISDVLFFAVMIFMMVARIKTNKIISTIVTLLFIAYALTKFVAVISDPMGLFHVNLISILNIIFLIYLVAEFIAFFNLWQVESGNLILTKKQTHLSKTPLENDLISLKQLVDNGVISEKEYNQKKNEILNKL